MAKGCPRCPPDQHPGPQERTTFRPGEVFGIRESVFTPIEHILVDMGGSGLTGDAYHRSQSSLHSICTQEKATHKKRPCILTEYTRKAPTGMTGARICIMCTFEKTPIENLPLIFRHFCVQVYTEDAPAPQDVHLHSLPEWDLRGDMQWIIMWPFNTTRELLGRWRVTPPDCRQRPGMAFGVSAMKHIETISAEKDREWKAFCASEPGFAVEQERQYRDYKDTWKGSIAGSRIASRGSQASTTFSRRPGYDAQSIASHTIYEDQVSLFDEKAQYAIYQPRVRGPESVRPKHTRRRSKGSKCTSNASSLASVNDGASGCNMGPKHRSPTHEAFANFTKRLSVVAPWGTA